MKSKKLSLNKKIVANLSGTESGQIRGGRTGSNSNDNCGINCTDTFYGLCNTGTLCGYTDDTCDENTTCCSANTYIVDCSNYYCEL